MGGGRSSGGASASVHCRSVAAAVPLGSPGGGVCGEKRIGAKAREARAFGPACGEDNALRLRCIPLPEPATPNARKICSTSAAFARDGGAPATGLFSPEIITVTSPFLLCPAAAASANFAGAGTAALFDP